MTKAFDVLYEEIRENIVETVIDRVIHDWKKGYTDKKVSEEDLRSLISKYAERAVKEIMYDIEYCLDEDRDDMYAEVRDDLERKKFEIGREMPSEEDIRKIEEILDDIGE